MKERKISIETIFSPWQRLRLALLDALGQRAPSPAACTIVQISIAVSRAAILGKVQVSAMSNND
ncbi:hypothetical protein E2562_019713 [Oryza meyeriana var. granulata]|uniref:Uncharacterized protein n=1 Tax=Oryza meyeriana var. granulata TaxID=110450 RepID=A0A6G1C871_9ORYZ|nr:hypothetical protein E2562_019713 [Oryza meyeriana var. granulata]